QSRGWTERPYPGLDRLRERLARQPSEQYPDPPATSGGLGCGPDTVSIVDANKCPVLRYGGTSVFGLHEENRVIVLVSTLDDSNWHSDCEARNSWRVINHIYHPNNPKQI